MRASSFQRSGTGHRDTTTYSFDQSSRIRQRVFNGEQVALSPPPLKHAVGASSRAGPCDLAARHPRRRARWVAACLVPPPSAHHHGITNPPPTGVVTPHLAGRGSERKNPQALAKPERSDCNPCAQRARARDARTEGPQKGRGNLQNGR